MIHKIGNIALYKSWDPDNCTREPFFIIEGSGYELEVDIKHIPEIISVLIQIMNENKSK